MSQRKNLTDTQRNWNIAKSYIKNGPNITNILKAIKYLLDGPSSYLTGAPEILPGFLAKTLLSGNLLEHQLSRANTISTNAIKALANKSREFEGRIMNKVLDNLFPTLRVIDYDKYRRAVLSELIPYQTRETTKYADYGLDRLGYETSMNPNNMHFNPATGLFEALVVKPATFTFESPRIPVGNAKHYSSTTLGHTRTFTNPDEPQVLNVLETQSDWAQNAWSRGTYDKMSKASGHRLEQLRKMIALLKEKGLPTESTQARIPLLTLYKDIPSWHILHLLQEYPLRQLLENMLFASRNGYSKMRYPTRDTAIKVEGYEPILLFGDPSKEQYALNLLLKIGLLEFLLALSTNIFNYRKISLELSRAKLEYEILKQHSIRQVYSPQLETVLRRYDLFPKIFGKVFKDLKPSIVTDSKNNSWFEFSIPLNMLLMELQYKDGGKL